MVEFHCWSAWVMFHSGEPHLCKDRPNYPLQKKNLKRSQKLRACKPAEGLLYHAFIWSSHLQGCDAPPRDLILNSVTLEDFVP